MNHPSKIYVRNLIGSVIDGRATAEEVRELERIMDQDDAECDLFLEYALMNAQLGLTDDTPHEWPTLAAMQQAIQTAEQDGVSLLPKESRLWKRRGFLAAATAAMGGVLLWPWSREKPLVTIVRSVGPRLSQGGTLPQGECIGQKFQLEEGLLEFSFKSADAVVVVEAPARFQVLDAKTLRVEKGRISAHVQDGQEGIRILTPEMNVLDLGTRFAVDVAEKGVSEVHVFEGKVEAGDIKRSRQATLVRANEAFRISRENGAHTCELRTATFIQPEEILPLNLGFRSGQAARADEAFARIQKDPSHLATISSATVDACSFCEDKRPRPVQGRFPGRLAFDFVAPDDAIRLNWAPRTTQFTLMTWVRLNQTLENLNAIYNTNEWDTLGQVHWMIDNQGRMRFAIHGGPGGLKGSDRPPTALWVVSETPLKKQLARWVHLAVTYDAESRRVRLYVNGELDTAAQIEKSLEAVLGPGEIGNWQPIEERRRRRFSGRMDEFLAFSREFHHDEIRSYHDSNTPYR